MESTYFIKSKSGNAYIVNIEKKTIHLVHPALFSVLSGESNVNSFSEREYYKKKIAYYIKHNIISDKAMHSKVQFKLSAKDVEKDLANLRQLTFEVTEKCNLKCKYCYYGEYYNMGEDREFKELSCNRAKKVLDYLVDKQLSFYNQSLNNTLYISFYGGEPLVNMPLITDVIDYSNKFKKRRLQYSMTTNATLLKRHIDYLVKHNVNLLISLDGDEHNNIYRTYNNGKNCFDNIWDNVHYIRQKYPDYYENNVNFNAVLHNKNSVSEIYDFFKMKLEKIPRISELNASGIQDSKKDEFYQTYRNFTENLNQSENYEKIESDLFVNAPSYNSTLVFLYQYLWFVFKSYQELLIDNRQDKYLSTGTCRPFSKKMFITADGKILPCEKISHKYLLGQIREDKVCLDYEEIANKYNSYYSKLSKQCTLCYRQDSCSQCFFFIDNLETNPICHGFMNKKGFINYIYSNINFLESHQSDYIRMMTEINVV